ncbi:dihydrolipoyl dehydrogenase [Desulfospira joergensenii]|uniref:dihydrolipoyl dehydrogenase n=1 Tax=Desulfospira joergensenii TaxID=53329 RepID=UPI0003B69582|nr:dihydrolipoyl dehydrogenase [Desulfospira joergensenii]
MAVKIVIIGGGPGGYVAALKAADLGGEVVLVEKENLGGTCLNWGCIPSKIMKNSAELLENCHKASKMGISIEGKVSPDIAALMDHKDKILSSQRKGIESLLSSRGIRVERGFARIKSRGIVQVASEDGTDRELDYDRLILAVGTKPMNVADFPFDHAKILSSNDILCLDKIPESLTIVGGGVIGCEFAFIFSALGTEVTVVEAMSRPLPLPSVDKDISKLLGREMKKNKIKLICDTVVTAADTAGQGVRISLSKSPFTDNPKAKDPKSPEIESDLMAVCIGRTPLSSDLGLENIGLETDRGGWIPVNDSMETPVENVYAIGDILGPSRVMLAHVASHEGIVAAESAMGGSGSMDYKAVPGAIFTMPEIGTVGLSEEEAVKKRISIETASVNFRVLGKAQAIDEIAGQAKMIVEKDTGRILGVHLMGAHATDLIAEATLAVEKGITAQELAHTIHAHPTLGEIMGEVASKAAGFPIHG